jgi:hypothetical protein|tara:strand:- start:29 stop:205 length:177 start_codon:yes stop_codon:yes gene_type:complete
MSLVEASKSTLKPYIDEYSNNTELGAALRSSGKIVQELLERYNDEELGIHIRQYYNTN